MFTDTDAGGLRYTSRVDVTEECWAIFDTVAVWVSEPQLLSSDDADLHAACTALGLVLTEGDAGRRTVPPRRPAAEAGACSTLTLSRRATGQGSTASNTRAAATGWAARWPNKEKQSGCELSRFRAMRPAVPSGPLP